MFRNSWVELRRFIIATVLVSLLLCGVPTVASAMPYYVAGWAVNSQSVKYNSWGTAASLYWYPSDVLTLASNGDHVNSIYVRTGDQYSIEVGVHWDAPNWPRNLLVVIDNYAVVCNNLNVSGHNCTVGAFNPYTITYTGGNDWGVYINNEWCSGVTNHGVTYGNSMIGSERLLRVDSTHDWNRASAKYCQYKTSAGSWVRPTGFSYINTDNPPYTMRYDSSTGWLTCDTY